MAVVESEKTLERKLAKKVEALGGWSLKLLAVHISGLPDRICLLPGGKVFFVEVKTTKQKPRKIQLVVHERLKKLGFPVYVVDTSEGIEEVLNQWDT